MSPYNIDALKRYDDNGRHVGYHDASGRFIRDALRCGHTAHIQTDHGTLAIRPYTIDEVRINARTGEPYFPGEAVGHNWLLEFYPNDHASDNRNEIQWRGRNLRKAIAFAYSQLNQRPHRYRVGQYISWFANQANREATVLAILDDEVLIEYEMPGTTSQWGYNRRTGQYRHPARPTSALVLCRGAADRLTSIRTYPHRKLPKKWIAAMHDQGTTDWIGEGQRETKRVPFPAAFPGRRGAACRC